MTKERADVLCVNQGLFESREKAKRAIMAGIVYNDNIRIDKAGEKVESTAELRIKGKQMPYVSRGGLKLEKAINELGFDVKDKVMLDIGSSTGGSTDCALRAVLVLAEHPCLSQRAAIGLHTGQAKCGLADGSHASHRATWQPWELQGSNSHLAQEALQTV